MRIHERGGPSRVTFTTLWQAFTRALHWRPTIRAATVVSGSCTPPSSSSSRMVHAAYIESPYVLFTGPYFLGIMFSWGLQGVLFAQFHNFWVTFSNQRMRIFAATLFFMTIIHTIFATLNAWMLLVYGWGDSEAIEHIHWSACVQPFVTGITSAMVQIFFARRIWIFKKGNIVAQTMSLLIVLIALAQCLSAMISSIRFGLVGDFETIARLSTGIQVWLAGSALCDVLISATLITYLFEARQETNWRSTQGLLTRLIVQSIETGSVTSIVAIIDLVLLLTMPQNNVHVLPNTTLPGLYTFVAFWTLNSRTPPDRSRSRRRTYTSMAFADSPVVLTSESEADTERTRRSSASAGAIHIFTDISSRTEQTTQYSKDDFELGLR